jgi:hypothetical protein
VAQEIAQQQRVDQRRHHIRVQPQQHLAQMQACGVCPASKLSSTTPYAAGIRTGMSSFTVVAARRRC